MILKSLFRRKGRTVLTLVGIAIGVAAIVALGAMAEGMHAGYTAMARGSQADLVLTRGYDVMDTSVDESIAEQLLAWPEVADVSGMLMGTVKAEDTPYFYVFGHDPRSFSIGHFKIVAGQGLGEARGVQGKPCLLGRAAAESFDKHVGDTLRVTGGVFRIVGIYETGDAFEEGGAVISLADAQALLLHPRHVSLFHIRLRDPAGADRLRARVERRFGDLTLSTTSEFADRQQLIDALEIFTWGVSVLAVIIGGIGMTNTLFMSVFERTHEIGLLRALGWRRGRVLRLILGESLALSSVGGLAGVGLGVAVTILLSGTSTRMGRLGAHFPPGLFARALVTVAVLGLAGGAYPAWWASRLLPLEALRYEGGAGPGAPRLLPGGMTLRSLWRRRTRTVLTALGIAMGIATIVALVAVSGGFIETFTAMFMGAEADLMALEADCADLSYSSIDERIGARLSALPDVQMVSGVVFAFDSTEELPVLVILGYHPREFAVRHFKIADGQPLTARRQAIVGRRAAKVLGLEVGDTLHLLESAFRVVGIFETGISWEETCVVVSLREAQTLAGKPHQVGMYAIKVADPARTEELRAHLGTRFPEIAVSLTSDFAESLPDVQSLETIMGRISLLAVFIGGVGMTNTMLMSVLERTREIGVLRALGWRRRQVIDMILREALALGATGGLLGMLLGVGLVWGVARISPGLGEMVAPRYSPQLFAQALAVALAAGVVGGLYPAWRATRMRPVEALRYE
jgi:ABC-type lipoprotein release transport system permease subunit